MKDFIYPSISSKLFSKSIDFAKSIQNISDNDLNIIMNLRETLWFHHEQPWMKENGEEDFDILVECHQGMLQTKVEVSIQFWVPNLGLSPKYD